MTNDSELGDMIWRNNGWKGGAIEALFLARKINNKAIQHTLDKILSEMPEKKNKHDNISDDPEYVDISYKEAQCYNTAHQEFVELINKVKGGLPM